MPKMCKSVVHFCGFLKRKKTLQGRKILKNRRKKGRQNLVPLKK